jgi:hypothetical protein
MLLQSHPWRISYSSDTHNPVTDFYIPALECAISYDRKAGFFNSSILSAVARGLGAMLENLQEVGTAENSIRLIMGCQFSPKDLEIIHQGYELRQALENCVDRHFTPPANFAQLHHFSILSWLIQHNILDIRIAIPLKPDGNPEDPEAQLEPHRLFHEKTGIITDSQGHQIAFNGSNNESMGGWYANVESFHIYCSWEGGRELVEQG